MHLFLSLVTVEIQNVPPKLKGHFELRLLQPLPSLFFSVLGTLIPIGYEHPFLLDTLNLPGPVPNELLLPGYRQESTGRELLRSPFLARPPSGWERRGRTGVETRWRRERRGGRRSRRDDVGSAGESIERKKLTSSLTQTSSFRLTESAHFARHLFSHLSLLESPSPPSLLESIASSCSRARKPPFPWSGRETSSGCSSRRRRRRCDEE